MARRDEMYQKLFGNASLGSVLEDAAKQIAEIASRSSVTEFKTYRRNGVSETVLYPASGSAPSGETSDRRQR